MAIPEEILKELYRINLFFPVLGNLGGRRGLNIDRGGFQGSCFPDPLAQGQTATEITVNSDSIRKFKDFQASRHFEKSPWAY